MKNSISSTNVSFNYLSNSKDFLQLVLNNICNAVLLMNKDMELQAFNDVMKTMFSNKKDEYLLYKRCGEALGCANTVDEFKDCGKTSQCCFCSLRESALISYMDKKAVFKEKIQMSFYKVSGKKVLKFLQFSTRPFYFENDYYIILIIEDISEVVKKEEMIRQLQLRQ